MRGLSALLIAALGLAGCDRFTGVADQKMLDSEAVGYACRVSLKVPEDCMKENEGHSPASILKGWKTADSAIKEGAIDPTMGKRRAPPQPAPPAVAVQSEVKPAESATPATASKAAPQAKKPGTAGPERKAAN